MAEINSTLNPATIEQARWIVSEISNLAQTSRRLSIDSVQMAGDDDSLVAIQLSNQVIAEKIGFLADLCSVKFGSNMVNGDAEEWMLPPAYHEAAQPKSSVETV